jgi:outer membrane murein-binding lipoprotein Lpp
MASRAQAVMVALSVYTALIAGCGSSSSKPDYCSSLSSLEASIKALPSTDVVKNGTSALESALKKVQSDANAVVSGAKSDFPNETSALKSSIDALSTTVKQLTSSPSAATLAQVPGQVTAVANAVKGFTSAASSKCG